MVSYLKRRYIKIYASENASHRLTVFDKSADDWAGRPEQGTTFPVRDRDRYIHNNTATVFLPIKKEPVGRGWLKPQNLEAGLPAL